jgi:hypothetical protein
MGLLVRDSSYSLKQGLVEPVTNWHNLFLPYQLWCIPRWNGPYYVRSKRMCWRTLAPSCKSGNFTIFCTCRGFSPRCKSGISQSLACLHVFHLLARAKMLQFFACLQALHIVARVEISQFLACLHTFHLVARVEASGACTCFSSENGWKYPLFLLRQNKNKNLHSGWSKTLTFSVYRFRVEG